MHLKPVLVFTGIYVDNSPTFLCAAESLSRLRQYLSDVSNLFQTLETFAADSNKKTKY